MSRRRGVKTLFRMWRWIPLQRITHASCKTPILKWICEYVYICTHTHTHTHTDMHIYIYTYIYVYIQVATGMATMDKVAMLVAAGHGGKISFDTVVGLF